MNLRELYLSNNGIEVIEGLENNVSSISVSELLPSASCQGGWAFPEAFVPQLLQLHEGFWVSWKDHKNPSIGYIEIPYKHKAPLYLE